MGSNYDYTLRFLTYLIFFIPTVLRTKSKNIPDEPLHNKQTNKSSLFV